VGSTRQGKWEKPLLAVAGRQGRGAANGPLGLGFPFFKKIFRIYIYIYIYIYIHTHCRKTPKIILTQINIYFVEEYYFSKNSILNKRSSPKENKV
jgi:hypothetical protein